MSLRLHIAPLFLSALILFSGWSFSLHVHTCQGAVQSLAINQKAKACQKAEEANAKPCPFHPPAATAEEDCCNDLQFNIEMQDENLKTSFEWQAASPTALLPSQSWFWIDPAKIESHNKFQSYRAPPIVPDITLLVQSFLL